MVRQVMVLYSVHVDSIIIGINRQSHDDTHDKRENYVHLFFLTRCWAIDLEICCQLVGKLMASFAEFCVHECAFELWIRCAVCDVWCAFLVFKPIQFMIDINLTNSLIFLCSESFLFHDVSCYFYFSILSLSLSSVSFCYASA